MSTLQGFFFFVRAKKTWVIKRTSTKLFRGCFFSSHLFLADAIT